MQDEKIQVSVLYATKERQDPIHLSLKSGATVQQAIEASKILTLYPQANESPLVVGIFGEIIHDPEHYPLDDGDRVDLYRPLLIDPKEARRQRVLGEKVDDKK